MYPTPRTVVVVVVVVTSGGILLRAGASASKRLPVPASELEHTVITNSQNYSVLSYYACSNLHHATAHNVQLRTQLLVLLLRHAHASASSNCAQGTDVFD